MPRRCTRLRPVALLVALAVAATGCGVLEDPVHSTHEEVLTALLALRDGAEVRATAELALDEGELRAALRDDREAREVLAEELDRGPVDVDSLLARLGEAQAALADHAVLLATGQDGSTRIAAEYRHHVWADLRVGGPGATDPDGERTDGVPVDLQLQVDWATASEVLARPDLLGDLDEVAAAVAPLLGTDHALDEVERVLLAFLAGELVGVSGVLGPDLLAALGGAGDGLRGSGPVGPLGGLRELDLDPREVARVALTFDDFRRDGDDTLVDVSLEVHDVAELVLDRLAEVPAGLGLSFEDVEEARAEVARLPERLTDVAVLRFDGAGVLRRARLDVADVLLQVARRTDPTDRAVEVAARLVGELDATGLFVVLDVEGVGAVTSVLGEPTATVTPEQLARAVGGLLLGHPVAAPGP